VIRVGSYAQLRVGDLEIAHFKSDVEPWIALVFTAADRRTRVASTDELDYFGRDPPWEITELEAPVRVVRDRLELTGADWGAAADAFTRLVAEKREILEDVRFSMGDEAIRAQLAVEREYLARLDLEGWVAALCDAPHNPTGSRLEIGTRRWLLDLWEYDDVRLCVRAALECRPDANVTLDLTDLIEGGWLSADDDPREAALLQFGWAERHASPIVVLTEGATDARVLETALLVTYPHLAGFIRFADFSHRPESNAGALVRTVKSFAAAGITNRMVALFDADTAACDALRALNVSALPQSIRVRQLPSIELARAYPTIGPTGGTVIDDVNGKACAIELYLGRDVLTNADGRLQPVRWTSFMPALDAWHGEIVGKREVLERFWNKAEAALANPTVVGDQDWSGLQAVIDQIRDAFVRGD
jgi:hypothetical protein